MSRVVLITGAAGGIGSATAVKFAQNSYSVALGYKTSENQAQRLAADLQENSVQAKAFYSDAANLQQAKKLIDDVTEHFGKVDVLVNNAGAAQQKLFSDITQSDFREMIDNNLTTAFNCSQAVLEQMIRRKSGKIINISSVWGIHGASCEVHYSAAKAAVIGMTKALAKEVAPSGITVNAVAPGVIDTKMLSSFSKEDLDALTEQTPLGRIGTGMDVANLIYFLSSSDADFITGEVITVDGGFAL